MDPQGFLQDLASNQSSNDIERLEFTVERNKPDEFYLILPNLELFITQDEINKFKDDAKIKQLINVYYKFLGDCELLPTNTFVANKQTARLPKGNAFFLDYIESTGTFLATLILKTVLILWLKQAEDNKGVMQFDGGLLNSDEGQYLR